jgi:hypothetical protein
MSTATTETVTGSKRAASDAADANENPATKRRREYLEAAEVAMEAVEGLKKEIGKIKQARDEEISALEREMEARKLETKAKLVRADVKKMTIKINMLEPDLVSYDEEWVRNVWARMVEAAGGDEQRLLGNFERPAPVDNGSTPDIKDIRNPERDEEKAARFVDFAKYCLPADTPVWKVKWDGRHNDATAIFATESEALECVDELRRLAKKDIDSLKRPPRIENPTKDRAGNYHVKGLKIMADGQSRQVMIDHANKTQPK